VKNALFRTFLALAIGASVIGLAGCRTAPVQNISDAPVTMSKSTHSSADVKKAIMAAGASLGWQMRDAGPGVIEGTLFLRSHMAQVTIPYTRDTYSITYKNSSNLNYDGTNIHSNYNGWVQNLDNAIKTQLLSM